MLVTVARDVYTDEERKDLHNAIEDLASPLDSIGFASNGVYLFFDPVQRELLYVGLARDLPHRFAQHNGIVKTPPRSCKIRQIDLWFKSHESLGYAVLLGSPLFQSKTSRQKGTGMHEVYDEETGAFFAYDAEALTHIRDVEGQLIADYRIRRGKLPPWNKIGSAQHSRNLPRPFTANLIDLTTGAKDSLLVARRTLRALEADATAYHYEEALHPARFYAAGRSNIKKRSITDELIWEGIEFHAREKTQQHSAPPVLTCA